MFEYDLVCRLHFREGLSRHELSRRTGFHRKTINKMLRYARPPGYRLKHPRPERSPVKRVQVRTQSRVAWPAHFEIQKDGVKVYQRAVEKHPT